MKNTDEKKEIVILLHAIFLLLRSNAHSPIKGRIFSCVAVLYLTKRYYLFCIHTSLFAREKRFISIFVVGV